MGDRLLVALVFVGITALPALGQLDPRGPAGTRAYPGAGLRELRSVAWTAKPGFRDSGAIAVSAGVIISGNVSGKDGTCAFDEATGQKLWSGPGHLKGAPAVDGAAAYTVNSVDGSVVAPDAAGGKTLWTRRYSPHNGHCPTAPSSANGLLYFGGGHQPGPDS